MSDREPIDAASPANVATPAANQPAVVTYPAVAGQRHYLKAVHCGYHDPADPAANPTGGYLTVEDGEGNVVYAVPITRSGAAPLNFPTIKGSVNTAMIVTLAAGGGAIEGVLSCHKYTRGPR